jgi:hypothetical protein
VSVPFLISYDWLQVFVVWFWFDALFVILKLWFWFDEKIEACGFYIIFGLFFFCGVIDIKNY